jgi:hypothetical protein
MNQSIDPLEVDTLPTDPRIMALRLLGMTTAEMKDIDKNIVGSGSNISGLRLDVNKMVDEFNTALAPVAPVAVQQPVLQGIAQPQLLAVTNTPPVLPEQAQATVNYDPNQLEFDFYKKITPEDLQYELKNINKNIKNLQEKIDLIYKELSTKKN